MSTLPQILLLICGDSMVGDAMDSILCHHGILGQKWGIRRFQNKDGTLTAYGKRRFKKVNKNIFLKNKQTKQAMRILKSDARKLDKQINKLDKKINKYSNKDEKKVKKYSDMKDVKKVLSSNMKMKYEDIKAGKKVAGKDFIVKSNYVTVPYAYVFLTGPRIGLAEVNAGSYIIEKKEEK